jgi:hypothetical protein
VFIQADYAPLGLMCFIAVGMAEVSTCEVTVTEGQHVTRGEEIGMFHFGGSTHCLVFGPEVNVQFELGSIKPGTSAPVCAVNSLLARVLPPIPKPDHDHARQAKRKPSALSDIVSAASHRTSEQEDDRLSATSSATSMSTSSAHSHGKKARLNRKE